MEAGRRSISKRRLHRVRLLIYTTKWYVRRYKYTREHQNTAYYTLSPTATKSHPRRQLPPPQVRGACRPRRGDPEQRVPVGVLEHGVVPGLAGADPGRDGGHVERPVDHLARGCVGGDGVADGEGACVAEQAGGEEQDVS